MANTNFLADLIDDLNHQQLTELLNHLALNQNQLEISSFRACVRQWRKDNNLPVDHK